jgi:Tol biopolymer transport system component
MHKYLRFFFICVLLTMVLSCNLITGGGDTEEQVQGATAVPTLPPSLTEPTAIVAATLQPTTMLPSPIHQSTPGSCPQNDGKLLFASEMNPQGAGPVNFEIFSANSDGSGISQLTNDERWNGNPAWAPEHCRIAFVVSTDQQSHEDIYIVNADGSGITRLTGDQAFDREPSWSPDGTQIVFMRELAGNRDIYSMNADGSAVRRLTDHPMQDEDPEWSPVNDEIVFSSRRDGDWEIYRMKSDGSDVVRLTNDKAQDTHPTWSPDGERIAFLSNRSDYVEVYVMDQKGDLLRQVTFQNGEAPSIDIELSWSQDGGWLAFTCTIPGKDGGGMQAVCAVSESGGEISVLVDRDPSRSHEPDW